MLGPLDDLDLADLRLDVARAEAAVDDPDASFLRLHDGHRRPRHRVHVGRHDRPLERQVLRHTARQIDDRRIAAGQDAAVRGQEEVVERGAVHQPGHGLGHGRLDPRKNLARHGAILTRLSRTA